MATYGKNLGVLIFQKRQLMGLGAKELAEELFKQDPENGATVDSLKVRISEIENGKVAKPRAKIVGPILGYLGITEEELQRCYPQDEEQTTSIRSLTEEEYLQRQELAVAEAVEGLKHAHKSEKTKLLSQIDDLKVKISNPEDALKEAQKAVAQMQVKLDRLHNILGKDEVEKAKTALEDEDYSLARALLESARAKAVLHKQDADKQLAEIEFDLGFIAEQEIRWHDAAEHYQLAARLNPCFRYLRQSWDLYWKLGDTKSGIVEADKLLDAAKAEFGKKSTQYGAALSCKAFSIKEAGDLEGSQLFFEEALGIARETIGEGHPEYAISLNNLALLYREQGAYEKAEPLYLQVIEIDKTTIGEGHPDYAIHLDNLAGLYGAQGAYEKAEPLLLQAIEIDRATIGEAHPIYAKGLNNLALLYYQLGRYERAEPLYLQGIEIDKATLGQRHPDYAIRLNNLAGLYEAQGAYEKAEPLYLQAIEIDHKILGAEHPQTKNHEQNYEIMQAERDGGGAP
ncbi:MAG: tetratricopeptide repeat protein [Pseudomonadota bacterium]